MPHSVDYTTFVFHGCWITTIGRLLGWHLSIDRLAGRTGLSKWLECLPRDTFKAQLARSLLLAKLCRILGRDLRCSFRSLARRFRMPGRFVRCLGRSLGIVDVGDSAVASVGRQVTPVLD